MICLIHVWVLGRQKPAKIPEIPTKYGVIGLGRGLLRENGQVCTRVCCDEISISTKVDITVRIHF